MDTKPPVLFLEIQTFSTHNNMNTVDKEGEHGIHTFKEYIQSKFEGLFEGKVFSEDFKDDLFVEIALQLSEDGIKSVLDELDAIDSKNFSRFFGVDDEMLLLKCILRFLVLLQQRISTPELDEVYCSFSYKVHCYFTSKSEESFVFQHEDLLESMIDLCEPFIDSYLKVVSDPQYFPRDRLINVIHENTPRNQGKGISISRFTSFLEGCEKILSITKRTISSRYNVNLLRIGAENVSDQIFVYAKVVKMIKFFKKTFHLFPEHFSSIKTQIDALLAKHDPYVVPKSANHINHKFIEIIDGHLYKKLYIEGETSLPHSVNGHKRSISSTTIGTSDVVTKLQVSNFDKFELDDMIDTHKEFKTIYSKNIDKRFKISEALSLFERFCEKGALTPKNDLILEFLGEEAPLNETVEVPVVEEDEQDQQPDEEVEEENIHEATEHNKEHDEDNSETMEEIPTE
ncbi:hypothetical protein PCE1_003422 [Barthelona sp. PCE]